MNRVIKEIKAKDPPMLLELVVVVVAAASGAIKSMEFADLWRRTGS